LDTNKSSQSKELLELLRRIRLDATAIQAKVSDAMTQLAALELPNASASRCGVCGIRLRGPIALAEHAYNSHAGPLPEHFIAAERAAGLAAPHTVAHGTSDAYRATAGQLAASSTARAAVSPAHGEHEHAAPSTSAARHAP
jgi:hypothetical protein